MNADERATSKTQPTTTAELRARIQEEIDEFDKSVALHRELMDYYNREGNREKALHAFGLSFAYEAAARSLRRLLAEVRE